MHKSNEWKHYPNVTCIMYFNCYILLIHTFTENLHFNFKMCHIFHIFWLLFNIQILKKNFEMFNLLWSLSTMPFWHTLVYIGWNVRSQSWALKSSQGIIFKSSFKICDRSYVFFVWEAGVREIKFKIKIKYSDCVWLWALPKHWWPHTSTVSECISNVHRWRTKGLVTPESSSTHAKEIVSASSSGDYSQGYLVTQSS